MTKHLIDKRADAVVAKSKGDADDLLPTQAVAKWLDVSDEFLEVGRCKGYGPPFIRMGTRRIRYRRADVVQWLKSRTYQSTSQYMK